MRKLIDTYVARLMTSLGEGPWDAVETLAQALVEAKSNDSQVFICGNGGSAGNAVHLANDYLYGIEPDGAALRVEALPANSAVLTCLGNDIGYENIFAHQLKVKGRPGDLLIALSGSGNSPNIVKALEQARVSGISSFAILGYFGGKAKALADVPIHFAVEDMQISEDLQLIVGHMLMQHLRQTLEEKCG